MEMKDYTQENNWIMKRFYMVFGDYFHDGHGCYKQILVQAPSEDNVLIAEANIEKKYPGIFHQMANEYQEPTFGPLVWQALRDTKYPAQNFALYDDNNAWDDVYTIDQLLEIDPNPYFSIDLIIDTYIWLLNSEGADIIYVPDEIPTLWQLAAPGYGCWD